MKDHQGVGDLHKLIEDYREKQRNIVWPDPLINATRADRFLWNGSPNPTRVQKVASWLIGSVLFAKRVWVGHQRKGLLRRSVNSRYISLCLYVRGHQDFS